MERGWVKLFRKIDEWEWFTDPATAHLFIYLLAKANRKPTRYKGVEIPAGGLTTSRADLAKATGLTQKQVRTAIDHLVSTGEVAKQTTRQYTLLIVNNWNLYQADGQRGANERANEGPTNSQKKANERANISEENSALHKADYQPQNSGGANERANEGSTNDQKRANERASNKKYRETRSKEERVEAAVSAFTNDESLQRSLSAFFDFMFRSGKGITDQMISKHLADLKELCGSDTEKMKFVVEDSLSNSWKGFFQSSVRRYQEQKPNLSGLPDWYADKGDQRPATKEQIEEAKEMCRKLRDERNYPEPDPIPSLDDLPF